MSDISSANDRALERHCIHGDVDVYDSLRDVYLGRLVNIHVQGMMIVGDLKLDEDRLYEIDMHLPPVGSDEPKVLRLGVDCLWTRSADENNKHWTGFSIIDLSPQDVDQIHRLIDAWGHC
jgi:hypothetical protein